MSRIRESLCPPVIGRGREGPPTGSGEPLLGSYFVSAYPPFGYWGEGEIGSFEDRLARPPAAGDGFGLYLHVPFCAERCNYCYYLAYDGLAAVIDRYLELLVRELEIYAERPLLAGRRPSFVYFGGGTPSLLTARRIRALLAGVQRVFPWREAREVSFECAPLSVTPAKLEALRELGVTRVSLGIQQLDDEVLRVNGRIHRVADVERAFALIRSAGFAVVNVDLIAGLIGQTDATFDASLERVIEMAPDCVTIYLLEIPHNTPLYRSIRKGTVPAPPVGWERKRARLAAGFERLERAGYTVRSAYAAVRDPKRHAFLYQDEQYRGVDLLGVGASAFSYLGGVHHQNVADLSGYLERLSEDRLPLWRAYALSAEERFVRELVLQLKLGRVETATLRERFGIDPVARFAPLLERLAETGYLELEGSAIAVTRQGLLRVDRWLRDFYLARHSGEPGSDPGSAAGRCVQAGDPGG